MHRIIAIIVGLVTGGLRMITLPADSEVGQATAWNWATLLDDVKSLRIRMQLENIASIVNPDGGIFLMQDILGSSSLEKNINHPLGPFLYTISCMHCMSVSLAQNEAGLGAMWGEERAIEMLKNAGFINVEVKTLAHVFQNYYYIAKKT